MTRVERWTLSLLATTVGVTGFAYLWMKYLLTPIDPFAVVNHPWQPYMLDIHVLTAPALMVLFGMVWSSHVRAKIAAGRTYNRRTGLVSFWGFIIMATSGYLLQVLTNDLAHQATFIVHLLSGSGFLLAYGGHLVASFRRCKRDQQVRSAA